MCLMRPVEEIGTDDVRNVTLALTGNGNTDRVALKALTEHTRNNNKRLWIPTAVAVLGRGSKRNPRLAGFSILQAIKSYIGKYELEGYLVVIDKEYVSSEESLESQIHIALTGFGFPSPQIEHLVEQAFLVLCEDCAHKIQIRIVVCGDQRRIEENIAKLIFFEYGVVVEPEKGAITKFYRERRTDLYSLIKHSSPANIRRSFNGLMAALDSIDNSE